LQIGSEVSYNELAQLISTDQKNNSKVYSAFRAGIYHFPFTKLLYKSA